MTPVAATPAAAVAPTVTDNPALDRYELRFHGDLAAKASYRRESNQLVFTYTELMPGYEGRGLGQLLATQVLEDVRRRGLTVVPRCPFMSTFIEDHPQYGELISSAEDAPLTA